MMSQAMKTLTSEIFVMALTLTFKNWKLKKKWTKKLGFGGE